MRLAESDTNHLQMNLSAIAIQSSPVLIPLVPFLFILSTHFHRGAEVHQDEGAHFSTILYSDITNVPISSTRS